MSFCSGGCLCMMSLPVWPHVPSGGLSRGSLSGGVSVQGVCRVPPPYGKERAVRILLECIIITGRNEVVAKVIFLHLSVILFTGGVSASVHAEIPPPPSGADTPGTRHPPPSRHHPPGADTPPGADPPGAYMPPGTRHPPGLSTYTPWD